MELAQVSYCGPWVIREPVEGPPSGQLSAQFNQLSLGRGWAGWHGSSGLAPSASEELPKGL